MARWRSYLLLNALLLWFFVLIVRSAIITLGDESTTRANMATISRSSATYQRLSNEIGVLESLSADIEKHSLGEIKEALNSTLFLVKDASAEIKAQRDSWDKIQALIRKDRINFLEIRQQLGDLQKLQSSEIVRLKTLLDETTRPSLIADMFNLCASFISGIIASLIASHVYASWKSRTRSKNNIE